MTYQRASIASPVEQTLAIMYSGIGRKIRIKSVNNVALRWAFIGLKGGLTGTHTFPICVTPLPPLISDADVLLLQIARGSATRSPRASRVL
jgi:hypothetical protein